MRILIPIDGSSQAQAGLAFLASRRTLIDAGVEVELLNVQYPIPPRAARAAGGEMVRAYHEAEAQDVTGPAAAMLAAAGITATVKNVVGSPAFEVAKCAGADGIDLIVMGSHGHTGFKKLLFGSVTNAVLASSSTPLLVLRAAPPNADALRVGIALDGSDYGTAAVKFLIAHRALFGALPHIALAHVVPDYLDLMERVLFGDAPVTEVRREEVKAAQQVAFGKAMATPRTLLQAAGLYATELCLTSNSAGDEIAAWAKKSQLDVLIIGSHGDGAMLSGLLGSTATRVAAQSDTALLFIQLPT